MICALIQKFGDEWRVDRIVDVQNETSLIDFRRNFNYPYSTIVNENVKCGMKFDPNTYVITDEDGVQVMPIMSDTEKIAQLNGVIGGLNNQIGELNGTIDSLHGNIDVLHGTIEVLNGSQSELIHTINEITYNVDEDQLTLDELKDYLIKKNKKNLADYLYNNPMEFNGKTYTITEEKQNQLTGCLNAYQYAKAIGIDLPLSWNETGGECVDCTFEELVSLYLNMLSVVKPIVTYQQHTEIYIRNATSVLEAKMIDITFDNYGKDDPTDPVDPTPVDPEDPEPVIDPEEPTPVDPEDPDGDETPVENTEEVVADEEEPTDPETV